MWVSEPQRGSRVSTEGEGPTGGVRAPARYGGGRVEVSPRRVRGTSLCVLGVGRGGSHKRLVTYKGIDRSPVEIPWCKGEGPKAQRGQQLA